MIFVLGDDRILDVYDSPAAVADNIEALDVEESVLAMYDERGQRYAVQWVWPNRHGRLFGLLPWSDNGVYRLRPDGPPDPAAARAVVDRAIGLGRPGPFASLAQVRASIVDPGPVGNGPTQAEFAG
jgi:hypothetical protein